VRVCAERTSLAAYFTKKKSKARALLPTNIFCFSLVFYEPSPEQGLDVYTSPDLDRALRLALIEQFSAIWW
jgi:hypothetical protein